jgi:tetratricopeptide (TPR) repeat protein
MNSPKTLAGPAPAKALRLKAQRLEREGDLAAAFEAYERAVALAPQDPELLAALAGLAGELEMHDLAVQLWARLSLADPGDCAHALGYARALLATAQFAEAIEVLKTALLAHSTEPRLWTTLGLALTYAGRAGEALTFFDEGVRLGPALAGAVYNRGLAHCELNRPAEAAADFQAALKLARKPSERATIEFSLATLALSRGDLAGGWSLYERRLSPDWPRSVAFQGVGRRLAQTDAAGGRSVLVLAEQGVGDEMMFAGALPDLIEEIGPGGRLVLAVDARLVDLFRRSFPSAEVLAHATPRIGGRARRLADPPPGGRIDLWSPLASLAQRYRPSPAAFPRVPYLKPDPARVEHWKRWLGDARPAVGLTWRSGKLTGERRRFYPAPANWADLLGTAGVQFVNLQYGDCAEDLAALSRIGGVEIRQPPGLNLKDDLDDLAALCVAVDGVVSVPNATGALAGACGAPVAFVSGPGGWTHLGQDEPPWYARARWCETADFGDWTPALEGAAEMVRAIARG